MPPLVRWSFKKYVDKIRWVGGPKLPIFVHVPGKNVHVEVGRWSKKGQNYGLVFIERPLRKKKMMIITKNYIM